MPDEIPEKIISTSEPVWLPQLLVDAELVSSSSEGRRMIKQNAVSLDGEKITDMNFAVEPNGETLLRVGKRRFCKILFQ